MSNRAAGERLLNGALPQQPQVGNGDVRVYSVQRFESDGRDAVSAAINIKNVGSSTRTVTVSIAWLGEERNGPPLGAGSSETITLRPQESREVTFAGTSGARDFKVNLAYPGG